MYYYPTMPKEKVTVTLDSAKLQELRSLVGTRSLSAAINRAIGAYLERRCHLAAVDLWLAELDREHGPAPAETLEWAAKLVEEWESDRSSQQRRAG